MTTENKWTKFSDQLPPHLAAEVFCLFSSGNIRVLNRQALGWNSFANCGWEDKPVSWHPITYPEVPKVETQKDRDRKAFGLQFGAHPGFPKDACSANRERIWFAECRGWESAIEYRDRENAADMKELERDVFSVVTKIDSHGPRAMEHIVHPARTRLRKRCGLDA